MWVRVTALIALGRRDAISDATGKFPHSVFANFCPIRTRRGAALRKWAVTLVDPSQSQCKTADFSFRTITDILF